MKVVFTPEATEQAEYCDSWWRELARELAETKALILGVPNIGAVYSRIDGQPVLRVLMKKTGHHLYYAMEPSSTALPSTPFGVRGKRAGPA